MYRLKAALIIALLVSALTGSVLYLSQSTSALSSDIIEAEHSRLDDIVREKLLSAEDSLSEQASNLTSDEKLIQELGEIHDRLLTMTPDQLKQNSNNWNKSVFDKLLDWKKNRQSEINQHDNSISDILRADYGTMSLQEPTMNWWEKAPDLVLAFAAIPLNDGNLASILVAQGFEGKQLNAGKSYEKTIAALDQINKHPYAQFGHFSWDRKMYMSVISPVMRDGNYIGTIVVGYELSKEMLTTLSESMPGYVDLNLVYASPKFGAQMANESALRVIYSNTDDNILKSNQFTINSNEKANSTATAYDQIGTNSVYIANAGEKSQVAVTRVRWAWDESQETDVYVMSNHNIANARHAAFQSNVIIAGLIALLAGLMLIILHVNSMLKNMARIKEVIAKAITSGEPIPSDDMSLIMGEDADALSQYVIKPLETPAEENADNWTDMMMDFTDEDNVKADAALAPEDKEKLKEAADVEEAKPIYEEYMRLRKENNINTPMDFDCFLRRLQRNAAKIKEQHHCEDVTFQVHVSDGNVLLKPRIIKKSSSHNKD